MEKLQGTIQIFRNQSLTILRPCRPSSQNLPIDKTFILSHQTQIDWLKRAAISDLFKERTLKSKTFLQQFAKNNPFLIMTWSTQIKL